MYSQLPHAQNSTDRLWETWPYIAGLIVIAVIGGLAILFIRRNLLSKAENSANESLMESLVRLRDSGEMSAKEYEATIRAMAQRMARAPSPQQTPKPTPADEAATMLAAAGIAPTQTSTPVRPTPAPAQTSTARPPAPPPPPSPPPGIGYFPPLIELPPLPPDDINPAR